MALRRWRELVDTSPPLEPRKTHHVHFGKLAAERDGRPVHLLGLELELDISVSFEGGGNHPGIGWSGEYARAALRDIVLRSGDHRWIDALDGEEVTFLSELRRGQPFEGRPTTFPLPPSLPDEPDLKDLAIFADGARAALSELKEYADALAGRAALPRPPRLVPNPDTTKLAAKITYLSSELGESPWDGAIPLVRLDEKRGANHLAFTVANDLKGTPFKVSKIEVKTWAVLCTLDELRVPTEHSMRAYDEGRTDMILTPAGRVMTCVIRDTHDAAGQVLPDPNVAGYEDITITIDNEVIGTSMQPHEWLEELNFRLGPSHQKFDSQLAPFLPIAVAQPGAARTRMHSGKIRVEIKKRSDANQAKLNSSRLLFHDTGRWTQRAMSAAKQQMGAPERGTLIEPRFSVRGTRSATHPIADILDHAAYWSEMPALVPRRKMRQKVQGVK